MQLVYNQFRVGDRDIRPLLLMANDPTKMTVKEVCAYLEISRTSLYTLMREGKIERLPPNPVLKVSPVYFRRADVEALKPPPP